MNLTSSSEIQFAKIYTRKIKQIRDPKISEFNFKVLHLLLSCNKNLVIWRKQESKLCEICEQIEDIPHLLYNCVFAQEVWQFIQQQLKSNISLNMVIYGGENYVETYLISLISYIIYKHWLLCKINHEIRTWTSFKISLSKELKYI